MPAFFQKRRALRVPIALNVVLMTLNVALMVVWIVLFANFKSWGILTIGTVVFSLILVGLSFYLVITIKEVRLNQRQANFVDSVTHELKTPIAALQLYLETLQLRTLDETRQREFYAVMERELQRLDQLINQLLEVGRLNVIGQETEPEEIDIGILVRSCAARACMRHNCEIDRVFRFDLQPATMFERRIMVEMMIRNIIDNAIKYGGVEPQVEVGVATNQRGRVIVRVTDNGEGVPSEIRKKIFKMFYRGGSELERKQKGTGLGLYIVKSLAHTMKGSVTISDREGESGSVFEVELPAKKTEPK